MNRVTIRPFNENDKEFFRKAGYNAEELAADRMIFELDEGAGKKALTAIEKTDIDLYGEEFLKSHAKLKWDSFLEEYVVKIPKNDYWNDPALFPLKTIDVEFVEMMYGEDTEIWKCQETGKYYMRQLFREPFARWLSCYKKHGNYQDRAEIRANITFRNGDQTETVTYNDWNGNAAYSDTFNPMFNAGVEGK